MEPQLFQEQVKDELKSMDQRLSDLEDKLTSMDSKLTQVVDAILGNPLTKQGGFVETVKELKEKIGALEKKVEDHEDFKKRIYWGIAMIGFLVVILEFVFNIYKNIK